MKTSYSRYLFSTDPLQTLRVVSPSMLCLSFLCFLSVYYGVLCIGSSDKFGFATLICGHDSCFHKHNPNIFDWIFSHLLHEKDMFLYNKPIFDFDIFDQLLDVSL